MNITKLLLLISLTILSSIAQKQFKSKEVYKSEKLIIIQVAENSFVHTSYKQTNDFGNVPCNGLVVRNNNEAIVFDTPSNDSASVELIQFIREKLLSKINAVIPTHFHDDCLGGLKAFHDAAIPSYANEKSIALAKENNLPIPQHHFTDSLELKVGNEKVIVRFLGEGHTKDNVVGYFPSENILFGGCLIKALGASKGYLGDANIEAWSTTVEKVKNAFPKAKIVIPGHGKFGNKKLLNYTIKLFKKK